MLVQRLDQRDLAAISGNASASVFMDATDGDPHVLMPALSTMQQSQRKGADMMLAGRFEEAAEHFAQVAGLHADGTAGRAHALRLRATALLRARRYVDALADAHAALACVGQPSADASTDKAFFELVAHSGASGDALAGWQLVGSIHEPRKQHAEAAHALGRAMLLACVGAHEEATLLKSGGASGGGGGGGGGRAAAELRSKVFGSATPSVVANALLQRFLAAAQHAPVVSLPLQVYVTPPPAAPCSPAPRRCGAAGERAGAHGDGAGVPAGAAAALHAVAVETVGERRRRDRGRTRLSFPPTRRWWATRTRCSSRTTTCGTRSC